MPARWLPVRPDLEQLRHQAKDLLRAIRKREPEALADLETFHPERIDPGQAKLADAQLVLARSYQAPSWPRLVLACQLVDAIWEDDYDTVKKLVRKHPNLIREDALVRESNWGPPMSYAANLGRDRIIAMLHAQGANDLEHAFDRAALQGKIDTAKTLHAMMGSPRPPRGAVMGPAETQNAAGMAMLLEMGAAICDQHGDRMAPAAMLLETYCRNPQGKHGCLELFARHGIELPDTPPMAVHRGRIDLLEAHLRRDPDLLRRTFSHQEIYPPELGCHPDETLALHGTPLAGGTLLHLCVDYDEIEMARWLLDQGMDPNGRAAVDADGFGGHTALFGCVVTLSSLVQKYRRLKDAPVARLLLDRGANPDVRASLRKCLRFTDDDTWHEYRDVTPLTWGEQFHDRDFVSQEAMRLIAERVGGR